MKLRRRVLCELVDEFHEVSSFSFIDENYYSFN